MVTLFDKYREQARWQIQRQAVDRRALTYVAAPRTSRRALFITHRERISASQIYPFFHYRAQIAERYGLELAETNLEAFEADPGRVGDADVVCLQTWFNIEPDRLSRVFDLIRQHCRPRRVVYFDSFAPTDLRLAAAIGNQVDVYVKKHVFRDRSRYGQATYGDTNLMEYYGRRYKISYDDVLYAVPTGVLDRLLVGPSFATADYMMSDFRAGRCVRRRKTIDVHARLGFRGTPWYAAMRQESLGVLEGLGPARVQGGHGVARRRYMRELARSKICYSPFGYGEVAWRDYEAVVCGSLLLKPDMSHVETEPDIFVAGETYVPVAWDFSDVDEKIRYYLEHEEEREMIVARAFDRLHRYFRDDVFLDQMRPVLAD